MSKRFSALCEHLRMNPVILFCAAVAVLSAACTFGGDVEAWRKKAEAENGTPASNRAVLDELYALVSYYDEIEAEFPRGIISSDDWAAIENADGLSGDQIGELDFQRSDAVTVIFDAVAGSNATATYASVRGRAKPEDSAFKALSESVSVISWAAAAKDSTAAPADTDFTEFAAPASGNVLTATVSGGLNNEDKIYIKVISGDRSRTVYYGYTISAGNAATITTITIGTEEVFSFGTPGTSLTEAPVFGVNGGVTFSQQPPPKAGA